MRAFIALELPEAIRNNIFQLQQHLRETHAKVSWVKPENLHCTLRFLGTITDQQCHALQEVLPEACAASPPLHLQVKDMGFFPNDRRPSVLWVGLQQESGDLPGVQQAIERAARSIGLKAETKRFHAHITLARIRDHRKAAALISAVKDDKDFDGGAFMVNNVALFSSELHPKGAIYRRIKEFPL